MQVLAPALLFGLVAFILFGVVAWLLVPGVRQFRQARASRAWPSTPGKIISASVVDIAPVSVDMDGDRQGSRPSYRPVIEYAYDVDGKGYRANHRVFGDESIAYASENKAQAAIADYSPERAVQVYYDPANPETAVLLPGRTGSVLAAIVAGVICLAIGLLFASASVALVLAHAPE